MLWISLDALISAAMALMSSSFGGGETGKVLCFLAFEGLELRAKAPVIEGLFV